MKMAEIEVAPYLHGRGFSGQGKLSMLALFTLCYIH